MRRTWWRSGDWNAVCDVCGFKFKASQLRQRWDGLMVCREDWETRHPQELIRPVPDQSRLPWTRPEPQDSFVSGSNGSTLNPNPQVAVPVIVITTSTTKISSPQGIYPVGPVIIPVVVPLNVNTPTLTINTLWVVGSSIIVDNQNGSNITVTVTNPGSLYTVTVYGNP